MGGFADLSDGRSYPNRSGLIAAVSIFDRIFRFYRRFVNTGEFLQMVKC